MQVQTHETTLDELVKLCEKGLVYAVLDACDEPSVPEKARALGEERATSLYNGTAQEDYWAIAPYLVQVDTDVLKWIHENLWTKPWGILAISTGGMAAVRAHFRKFLIVQSPEGEHWYFRFYDPRVLPVFLESSNDEELTQFFGPVQVFGVHEPEASAVRLMKAV